METNEKLMLTAEDVAEILQVKPSRAYTIIRQMNTELAAMGKLVIRGRVNRRYFEQKNFYLKSSAPCCSTGPELIKKCHSYYIKIS